MSKTVEKDKALAQVLADIEKQFGKGAIMKLGEQKNMEIRVQQHLNRIADLILSSRLLPDSGQGFDLCLQFGNRIARKIV